MDPSQFFKAVPSLSPAQIREFMSGKNHTEYNLVDVRQPAEYEQGHLPGAQLIPLGELLSRTGELDRTKPTIVY